MSSERKEGELIHGEQETQTGPNRPVTRPAYLFQNVVTAWNNMIRMRENWPVELIPYMEQMEFQLKRLIEKRN